MKISGSADSVSTQSDLADVEPFASALVAANPQRILWGTNWPHPGSAAVAAKATDLAPHVQTDDGKVLNLLPTWVPDVATRRLILTENPARLPAGPSETKCPVRGWDRNPTDGRYPQIGAENPLVCRVPGWQDS